MFTYDSLYELIMFVSKQGVPYPRDFNNIYSSFLNIYENYKKSIDIKNCLIERAEKLRENYDIKLIDIVIYNNQLDYLRKSNASLQANIDRDLAIFVSKIKNRWGIKDIISHKCILDYFEYSLLYLSNWYDFDSNWFNMRYQTIIIKNDLSVLRE